MAEPYVISVSTPDGEFRKEVNRRGYNEDDDFARGLVFEGLQAAIQFLRTVQTKYVLESTDDFLGNVDGKMVDEEFVDGGEDDGAPEEDEDTR